MLYKKLSIFVCLLFVATLSAADDSKRHQLVGGMSVYLGVIPAQLTQKEHPGMHGGSDKEHRYHVMVALFDVKSGKRIDDARVTATVAVLGLGGHTKDLEPMLGGALSYGNYFVMHKPEMYRILVEIKRGKNKSTANFVYERPKD